jgi:hypothetical protein
MKLHLGIRNEHGHFLLLPRIPVVVVVVKEQVKANRCHIVRFQ